MVAIRISTPKPSTDGKRRGFPWLLLILWIFVLAGIVFFLQSRPKEIQLQVTVPAGSSFIGEVIVDGQRHLIEGEGDEQIKHQFEYIGHRVEYVVLADDESGNIVIGVRLSYGRSGLYASNHWGWRGVSDQMTQLNEMTQLDEEQWREAMNRLRPTERESNLPGTSALTTPAYDENEGT